MKGVVTHRDMEDRKRKAKAFDEALAYLESHADNEASTTARDMLRRAVSPAIPPISVERNSATQEGR